MLLKERIHMEGFGFSFSQLFLLCVHTQNDTSLILIQTELERLVKLNNNQNETMIYSNPNNQILYVSLA